MTQNDYPTTLVAEGRFHSLPSEQRGLVVSQPMRIVDDVVVTEHTGMNQEELRLALLFWDQLVWPRTSHRLFDNGSDEEFLIEAGVMKRPVFEYQGSMGRAIELMFLETLKRLEDASPGQWALAQGKSSLQLANLVEENGRGALLQLYRAIPVPAGEVAIADILRFKERRRDELIALRTAIADFYLEIDAARDQAFAIQNAIRKIDQASAAVLKVGLEAVFPFKLSDLSASINLDTLAGAGVLGSVFAAGAMSLEHATSILGGKVTIDVLKGPVARHIERRKSPFRYVNRIHNELLVRHV